MTYRTSRLLDAQRATGERPKCRDLVPMPRHECLTCGRETRVERMGQLPLLRHGGHGAVRETTFRICDACRMVRVAQVQEVRS